MTVEEKIERLTGIVDALASSVVSHDNQIEGLIQVARLHNEEIDKLGERIDNLGRQLQAYLNRLPPQ